MRGNITAEEAEDFNDDDEEEDPQEEESEGIEGE